MIDTSNFTGTEAYHRFGLWPDVLTDGALHVAKEAGAFWLMDEISAHLMQSKWHKEDYFAVAKLIVNGSEATFELSDGNGKKIATKHIEYTDYPDPEVQLFCCWNGDRWVIMVPSEY